MKLGPEVPASSNPSVIVWRTLITQASFQGLSSHIGLLYQTVRIQNISMTAWHSSEQCWSRPLKVHRTFTVMHSKCEPPFLSPPSDSFHSIWTVPPRQETLPEPQPLLWQFPLPLGLHLFALFRARRYDVRVLFAPYKRFPHSCERLSHLEASAFGWSHAPPLTDLLPTSSHLTCLLNTHSCEQAHGVLVYLKPCHHLRWCQCQITIGPSVLWPSHLQLKH